MSQVLTLRLREGCLPPSTLGALSLPAASSASDWGLARGSPAWDAFSLWMFAVSTSSLILAQSRHMLVTMPTKPFAQGALHLTQGASACSDIVVVSEADPC